MGHFAAPDRAAPALGVFGDPTSVAVVGASEDPAKWGYWLASGALRGSHRRNVYFVNSRAVSVLGKPCAASLSELPEIPELVALCVPAAHVGAVVDEALELGTRGFLGITSGITDEKALAEKITSRGARLIGTNSLGIYDASTDLQLMWGSLEPGPMAIVSQSGQLGSELAAIAHRHGVGVSRFVSIGNQSDVTAAELLGDLATHEATRVIALYLESFTDGEALFDTLRSLRSSGKPTVLLTVGASTASARVARTHTGSLTSSMDVVDAVCRAAGVMRVTTPHEAVDCVRMLLTAPLPGGRRVGIVGDSGGQSGIAADVAAAAGLVVPHFPDALVETIAERLPTGAACTNPVDLAGAGERDLHTYATMVEHVVASGDVDAVVLTGYFGCYGRDVPALARQEVSVAERLGAVTKATGVPVVVHTMGPDSATAKALWQRGVPAFDDIASAMRALAAVSAPPPRCGGGDERPTVSTKPVAPGYLAARALLAEIGVPFPRGATIRAASEVDDAVAGLRAPFVLKAEWLEHKSEVGGVLVNVADAAHLRAAFEAMHARLGDGDYVVEEQDTRSDAVEILIGARRDPQLGAMVVVGAGGTETEIHADVRVECAPVSHDTAMAMLHGLRMAPLLAGWRGRQAVDVEAVADLVVAVSRLIADRRDIVEVELNPVRATGTGPLAVDALVIGQRRRTGRDDVLETDEFPTTIGDRDGVDGAHPRLATQ